VEALIIGTLANVLGGVALHRLLARRRDIAARTRWTFDISVRVRREVLSGRASAAKETKPETRV
jgi:hypothetical protein